MTLKNYPKIGETLARTKLANGLELLVTPKKGFLNSCAFFAAKYGSADANFTLGNEKIVSPAGVAHFLEHKMFDTEDGNALQRLSQNGANPNAFTSFGMTAYHFESPSNFIENLEIMLDFVATPYFTGESVDNEQGIIAQEIRMYEDNPNWQVFENLLKGLFSAHPVRENIAGTVESIAKITPEILYSCHSAFYKPSNMVLAVAGDLDPDIVLAAAERVLPKEHGETIVRDYGNEDYSKAAASRTEQCMQVARPLFMLGYKVRPETDGHIMRREILADLTLRCLAGASSPLYTALYAKGLINRGFDCDYNSLPGGGCLVFGGETDDPDTVAEAIINETDRIKKDGFDEKLFARVKKTAFGARLSDLNYFERICYGQAYSYFENAEYFGFPEIYEEMTAEQAAEFIKDFLRPELMCLSVVRRQKLED